MLIWCSDYWSVSQQKILLCLDHFYHRTRNGLVHFSLFLEWNYRGCWTLRLLLNSISIIIHMEGWRWCVVARVLFWLIYQSVMARKIEKKKLSIVSARLRNEWCASCYRNTSNLTNYNQSEWTAQIAIVIRFVNFEFVMRVSFCREHSRGQMR